MQKSPFKIPPPIVVNPGSSFNQEPAAQAKIRILTRRNARLWNRIKAETAVYIRLNDNEAAAEHAEVIALLHAAWFDTKAEIERLQA